MKIKRGDSFLLALVTSVDGVPQDLTNWEVRSSIATLNGFQEVADLTVTYTDRAAGEFTLSADTSAWPLGCLEFDVRYTTDSGQIVTTDSVIVKITKSDTP